MSDGDYELGLTIFETYHSIPNVNEQQILFRQKDDAEITIPEDSYEVRDINEFMKRAILWKRPHCDALETVDVVMTTTTMTLMTIIVKMENTRLRSAQIITR